MTDPGNVPSLCINQCVMDEETGLCLGCSRTIEEITFWSGYSNQEKKDVLELIAERSTKLRNRT